MTTSAPDPVELAPGQLVTEPGIYAMTADQYHADPVAGGSLSSHGARDLLKCPAVFRHKRDTYAPVHKPDYDEGTAAHLAVLGAGASVVVVNAPDWRTKAAQQDRDAAYAAGKTPILKHKWDRIKTDQVAAVRAHPLANAILSGGRPELVLVWQDETTGVWCRAMLDYLHQLWIGDYKTCENVDPVDPYAIRKAISSYGYFIQAVHYQDGAAALGLGVLPFYFVFQEKTEPYLVSVVDLDDEYRAIGRRRVDLARQIYRDCMAADQWPAYLATNEIATIAPPRWLKTEE